MSSTIIIWPAPLLRSVWYGPATPLPKALPVSTPDSMSIMAAIA